MFGTFHKTNTRRSRLSVLTMLAVLAPAGIVSPLTIAPVSALSLAEEDAEGVAAAEKSRIVSVALPEGAFRYSGKEKTARLADALKALSGKDKAFGKVEVLVWPGGESPKKAFAEALEEAGYTYTPQSSVKMDEGKITPFACTLKEKEEGSDKKVELRGIWIEQGETTLLTWAAVDAEEDKAEEPAPEKPAKSEKSSPAKETAKASSDAKGSKVPADLLGDWSWTTISSVNYKDTGTNRLAEPSGMSVKFTFTKDGRYKKFFYVRQRTYSLVSEATTTEEGTVTFGENSFTLHPEKGYYKGNTGSRIIDRPMKPEERKTVVHRWEWRTDKDKRQLYIGFDPEHMSLFRPGK